MVFIGFIGASSVGLWIGQRNLMEKEISVLRSTADYCQKAIAGLLTMTFWLMFPKTTPAIAPRSD